MTEFYFNLFQGKCMASFSDSNEKYFNVVVFFTDKWGRSKDQYGQWIIRPPVYYHNIKNDTSKVEKLEKHLTLRMKLQQGYVNFYTKRKQYVTRHYINLNIKK